MKGSCELDSLAEELGFCQPGVQVSDCLPPSLQSKRSLGVSFCVQALAWLHGLRFDRSEA